MSLRAARNVSAGRHWQAGRTLRANALEGDYLSPIYLRATKITS